MSSRSNRDGVCSGLSHYSDFEAMLGQVCNNYINSFLTSHLRGIVRCLLVSIISFRTRRHPLIGDPETIPYASRAAKSKMDYLGTSLQKHGKRQGRCIRLVPCDARESVADARNPSGRGAGEEDRSDDDLVGVALGRRRWC